MGDYVAKITNNIKLENIENFIDIEPIIDLISRANIDTIDIKSKEAIQAFNDALERRKKGVVDTW